MQHAQVDLVDWEQNIVIPEIDFAYTNRECKIEESKLIIGNSDFALTGELRNIEYTQNTHCTYCPQSV